MGACNVDGCDRTGRMRRGWCELHYRRWLRDASPGSPFVKLSYEQRLLSRFETDEQTGCWTWTGTRMITAGYGQIGRNGDNLPAHRAMWEHFKGPIPEGLVIDHLCLNRLCVNPDHLEVVTYSVNNERRFLDRVPHLTLA